MSVAVLISITDLSFAFTSWLTGAFDQFWPSFTNHQNATISVIQAPLAVLSPSHQNPYRIKSLSVVVLIAQLHPLLQTEPVNTLNLPSLSDETHKISAVCQVGVM